jgi:hypothetical protein
MYPSGISKTWFNGINTKKIDESALFVFAGLFGDRTS